MLHIQMPHRVVLAAVQVGTEAIIPHMGKDYNLLVLVGDLVIVVVLAELIQAEAEAEQMLLVRTEGAVVLMAELVVWVKFRQSLPPHKPQLII